MCVCVCKRERASVSMLFAAVRDLLLLLFEPWQQLLFYVATHNSEQTRISICEKHTSYPSACVCAKERVCAGWEEKHVEYYEMIMETGPSVTERTGETADVRCRFHKDEETKQHSAVRIPLITQLELSYMLMFCVKLLFSPTSAPFTCTANLTF